MKQTIEIKPALDFLLAQKKDDLSIRQLAILVACKEGAQTVRGLADRFKVTKPAITRGVDRLEHHGFVKRTVDKEDRRSVLLTHTAAGTRFAANFA